MENKLIAFNNHLARYADRLPSELKVEWNELFEVLSTLKGEDGWVSVPVSERAVEERTIAYGDWLDENTYTSRTGRGLNHPLNVKIDSEKPYRRYSHPELYLIFQQQQNK